MLPAFVSSITSFNSAEKVKAASDIQLAEIEHAAEGSCCNDDSTGNDGDSEAGGM